MNNAAAVLPIASVRLLHANRFIDRDFDYLVPDEFDCSRGSLVGVPFGRSNKEMLAVVVERKTGDASKLKRISFVLDAPYRLDDEALSLAAYISEHNFTVFGDICSACLPSGLHTSCNAFYRLPADGVADICIRGRIPPAFQERGLTPQSTALALATMFTEHDELPETVLHARFGEKLTGWLVAKKYLQRKIHLSWRTNVKVIKCIRLAQDADPNRIPKGTKREAYEKLFNYLSQAGENGATCSNMCDLFSLSLSNLKTLEKNGIVSFFQTVSDRSLLSPVSSVPSDHSPLSSEQNTAFEKLRGLMQTDKPAAALLFGVTGSGKTNVLLELTDACLSMGKSILYLVPEIALTAQAQEKFLRRFGETVCVLHSGLSEGERHDAWVSVKNGEKKVILGTRSAIFAPAENVGLIIMDEEQDDSYKSDGACKYHTRTVARFRATHHNALLVFASATPDVETYHKAQSGDYALVTLKHRYGNATLPNVKIADLRADAERNPGEMVGSLLKEEIAENLSMGEQTILLMNRRGYHNFLSCRSCGEVIRCPHCSVSMTLHGMENKRLLCHYCGFTLPHPRFCPSCGSEHLSHGGCGTEKLEEELQTLFPSARLLRMDADTTALKNGHENILSVFREHKADILIGTQMIAKGHDFPRVSLVGVINTDASLFMTDYRAFENTFSLLTQVIGRAGRGDKPGRAVIQTYQPLHPTILQATTQSYDDFFAGEIALRRNLSYPPFCHIALLTVSSATEDILQSSIDLLSDTVRTVLKENNCKSMVVFGPFEATIYKLRNAYRMKMLIKYKNTKQSRQILKTVIEKFDAAADAAASLSVDINPGLI